MDILELPSIPRERAVLQNLINTARRDRKIRRLKMWAAAIITIIALVVLMNRPTAPTAQEASGGTETGLQVSEVGFESVDSVQAGHLLYLPTIFRGEE